jgi:hypothetical protein
MGMHYITGPGRCLVDPPPAGEKGRTSSPLASIPFKGRTHKKEVGNVWE